MRSLRAWVPILFVGAFLFIGLYAATPPKQAVAEVAPPSSEKVCTTEPIPFETEEQENDGYDVGDDWVSQEGVEGEREICTLDGSEVSNTVTVAVVNEVRQIGTYVAPVVNYSYRIGAWCRDGSWSNATGRGACSWHGGVSEWAYE